LPEPRTPVANYLRTKRSGDTLYVSGLVSRLCGAVGSDITIAAAKAAARDTALDLLAIVKLDLGELDRIAEVVQMRGFVRSSPDFIAQPEVIDGASGLLIALWGEAGRHARTATGAAQLPYGAAVQLDMAMRLKN
jgi:enamine deaminase RidA (YjgF/YER057c/UK114 family)